MDIKQQIEDLAVGQADNDLFIPHEGAGVGGTEAEGAVGGRLEGERCPAACTWWAGHLRFASCSYIVEEQMWETQRGNG